MFARRTDWNLSPNRLAMLLDRLRRARVPVIDLTESNPTRCGLANSAATRLGEFARTASLAYDPDPLGDPQARESISAIYRASGADVPPERLLLTSSTSEAYSFLFRLLADPGDSVLAPVPSYPLFDHLALNDVTLTPYTLPAELEFALDMEALKRSAAEGARAVIVVNPGNPTGRFLRQGELEGLIEICRSRGMALICDEVFGDYALEDIGDRVRTAAGRPEVLTFCLNGLSKMLALPQLKLGWIAVSGPRPEAAEALRRLELIADTYLSVNTPAQKALPALLARREPIQRPIVERLAGNRALLMREAGPGRPCRCLPVEGGWYGILEVPRVITGEQWSLELLEKDRVLVHPGYFFDLPGERHLVVSLLPEPHVFREGIERLLRRVDRRAEA